MVERFGLEMEIKFNGAKTQMITFNKNLKKSRWSAIHDKWENKIKLNGEEIEEVEVIRYLGNMIELKHNGNCHLKLRKKLAFYATAKLEHIGLSYDAIEPGKKGFMYKTYIRPKLTYGIDNFTLNQTQIRKLQSTDGSMLKRLLNISKYCYNTELMIALGMLPMGDLYKKMRLSLFIRLCQNEIMYNLLQDSLLVLQNEKERDSIVKDVLELVDSKRSINGYAIKSIDELVGLLN